MAGHLVLVQTVGVRVPAPQHTIMGHFVQKIFSGSSNPLLADRISGDVSSKLGSLHLDRFSDGEIWIKFEENLRGNDIYLIQSTNAPAENILELALMIDAARRASAERINVVIPYFGYSRQDRKVSPRVPISAKVVMDLFCASGADRIITMDLHSTAIQGFTSIPVDNLYGSMVFLPALKNYFNNCKIDNLVVLSPDMGSSKLNQRYAKWLSADFALVDKRRYEHNQSEVVAVVGNPENKHILMVDDIIDTAGTIINAAKVAKERGALSVTVAATHGVFSGDAIQKIESSDIDKIFITDTIAENNRKLIDKIEMISSSKVFAEAITRVHSGGSVSELFKTRNIQ